MLGFVLDRGDNVRYMTCHLDAYGRPSCSTRSIAVLWRGLLDSSGDGQLDFGGQGEA